MAAELAVPPKRNRTRSPSYPYLALPAALEKAAALWKAEGRHAVAVNVAMQHWGYKEESSTGYSCVAALKKFGLAEHEGMGETRQVRLSTLALTILLDNDPGSPARRDALRTAALGPRIHAELWERYGAELPSDQSLRRFLVLERSFNEASVDELARGIPADHGLRGSGCRGRPGATPAAPSATPCRGPAAAAGAPVPAARLAPALTESVPVARNAPRPARPGCPPEAAARERAWNAAPAPRPDPRAFPARRRRRPGSPACSTTPRGRRLFRRQPRWWRKRSPRCVPRVPGRERETGPWSMARRELPVPLDNDLVARVPYPMTEEDFALLIDTLQLWKKRLVQPRR